MPLQLHLIAQEQKDFRISLLLTTIDSGVGKDSQPVEEQVENDDSQLDPTTNVCHEKNLRDAPMSAIAETGGLVDKLVTIVVSVGLISKGWFDTRVGVVCSCPAQVSE